MTEGDESTLAAIERSRSGVLVDGRQAFEAMATALGQARRQIGFAQLMSGGGIAGMPGLLARRGAGGSLGLAAFVLASSSSKRSSLR